MGEQSKGVKEQAEGGVFLQEGVRGGKRVGEGGVRMGEWVTGETGCERSRWEYGGEGKEWAGRCTELGARVVAGALGGFRRSGGAWVVTFGVWRWGHSRVGPGP